MGTVFKKSITRPVPDGAEIIEKNGQRFARFRVRGKLRTAQLTINEDGQDRITTKAGTYTAKFRDHLGQIVEKPTGCRDEQAARQTLAKWEREVEQIKAGTLDPAKLDIVRQGSKPLVEHLADYEVSLTAAGTSPVYRANLRRAVVRVCGDCRFTKLTEVNREDVERWLAERISEEDMSARSRNHYRSSLIVFFNWCRDSGRLLEHDLNKIPKADERSDPRRRRRALTEEELNRLLTVARSRPLKDAQTIRRGERKGELLAELRPEITKQLEELGRERVLIYQTLVLTGLRLTELRTLTLAQLDLNFGSEQIVLDAKNEKNRAGSTIPLRADLAEELRQWIVERNLLSIARIFTVPAGLRRILDRDMKAAGIPKRDERGRTVDVHALQTTFGTMLSTTGTAPRTAQTAMRHSDIKLTMGTYTDPKLLGVREAMERLPSLSLKNSVAPTPYTSCQVGSMAGMESQVSDGRGRYGETADGPPGFEPTTSCTPSKRASIGLTRISLRSSSLEWFWKGYYE
ncbi:MAG: tyrosine-type recombinase/integrase [Fimbriiglobus sp.]